MRIMCTIGLSILIGHALFAQAPSDSDLATKLKLNASLYSRWDHGPSLRAKAQATNADVISQPVFFETVGKCDGCSAADPMADPKIMRATESSDIVVIGHVTKNISAFTEHESFIFTDSELLVDEVWKNSNGSPDQVSVGQEITVTTPGGKMEVEGHRVQAYLTSRIPLMVNHSYLLFLKYVPESNSYKADTVAGFDITDNTVIPRRTGEPTSSHRQASLLASYEVFRQ